jgi:hypothetical protein
MVQMLRTSERGTFKECPLKWDWAYNHGLAAKRDSNPLWFGQGIHIALAEWYLPGFERGPHPADTWEDFCSDEERFIPTEYDEDELKYVDAKELGISMMEQYVDHYGTDERWNVIATEQTFRTLISDPRQMRKPGDKLKALVKYVGTFDGVYRDEATGEIFLMEHKTAAGIQTQHLPLDDQAGSYWYVAARVLRAQGLIGPRENIAGIQYNFLRKATPDDRLQNAKGEYLNKNGTVSKRQPPPNFLREVVWRSREERRIMERRIQDEALHMEAMRSGLLPIYKKPTRDCSWRCEFYKMCMLDEAGADVAEYAEAVYRKRDPYGDHRENRKSA